MFGYKLDKINSFIISYEFHNECHCARNKRQLEYLSNCCTTELPPPILCTYFLYKKKMRKLT